MYKEETTTPTVDRDRFVKHLERASETVRSWPLWKQTILGGIQFGHPVDGTCEVIGSGRPGKRGEDIT